MSSRRNGFGRGLVVGVILGAIATASGSALASLGKSGWHRGDYHFKTGYVAGFLDCVGVAQVNDSRGFVAREYKTPPEAKHSQWARTVSELYQKEEHNDRRMPQMMMLAGHKLAAKYDYSGPGDADPRLEKLKRYFEARRKKKEAAKQAAKESGESVEGSHPEAPVEHPTE